MGLPLLNRINPHQLGLTQLDGVRCCHQIYRNLRSDGGIGLPAPAFGPACRSRAISASVIGEHKSTSVVVGIALLSPTGFGGRGGSRAQEKRGHQATHVRPIPPDSVSSTQTPRVWTATIRQIGIRRFPGL